VVDGEVIEVLAEQRRVGEVIYLDDIAVYQHHRSRSERPPYSESLAENFPSNLQAVEHRY
jgi:hypothetical protein